jgi:two-component system, NarL family, nitrate/nitrite response regulator NarL
MESRSLSGAALRKTRTANRVEGSGPAKRESEANFRIFVADRDMMSSHLLANALSRDKQCRASAISSADLLRFLDVKGADLVVLGAETNKKQGNEFDLAQAVKRAYPELPIVLLLNQSTRESVMSAFRSGARGVFSREEPMNSFLDCVEQVRKGYIWAGAKETTFLLDAIRSAPFTSLSSASKSLPLTYREGQVVQYAARGKPNRVIALELGLSEHTVKNYLYRAFEKLGVSNRVELLFYLSTRGQDTGSYMTSENAETDRGKPRS